MRAIVQSTGEVIEFNCDTEAGLIECWALCNEYKKAYQNILDQLKVAAQVMLQEDTTLQSGNYLLRMNYVEKKTYDKSVMRQILDEDTLDLFLVPDKPRFDKYLAEHLREMGDNSHLLRQTMIPLGKPYTVFKLERLKRR